MDVASDRRISVVPKPDRRRQSQGAISAALLELGAHSATGADVQLPVVRPESRAEAVGTWVVGAVSVGLIVLVALLSLG